MDIDIQLENYGPNRHSIQILEQSRIVLCVGIIAAGKDTIQKKLVEMGDYHPIVTCTTRSPRINNGVLETNGVDYHFLNYDEMKRRITDREMIEVNKFGDNYYGTHIAEFEKALNDRKIALGDIDVNGIASFRKIAASSVKALFIVPPDYATWRERLIKRYSSQELFDQEWQKRRDITVEELETALRADYYHFIINDDLTRAVRVIDEISNKNDTFNQHDDEARQVARELLVAIQAA